VAARTRTETAIAENASNAPLIQRACEPIAFEVQEVMRFECHANTTATRS
jgi:hypothetical protein